MTTHSCPGCGAEHEIRETEAAEAAAVAPVLAVPATSDNDVKIAEIQAAERVEVEKIYQEGQDVELREELARLRGQLVAMREIVEAIKPAEPEPPATPVVIDPPAPAEPAEPVISPPPPATPAKPGNGGKKGKAGWWDNYR